MSSPLNLSIDIEFAKQETDYSKCAVCEQLIIGNMFTQVVTVAGEKIETSTKVC